MPDTSHVAYLVYCPECGDIVAEFATIDDAQRYAVDHPIDRTLPLPQRQAAHERFHEW